MKKKILLLIGRLSSGGAEHQISQLANMLCEEYDITIVTWIDSEDHYFLDKRIKRIRIGKGESKYKRLLKTMKYIYHCNMDCVISYSQQDNIIALAPLMFRRKIKAIASERNFSWGVNKFYEFILNRILYKRASYIVPNNFSQGEYLSSIQSIKNKIRVIINYTDINTYIPTDFPNNTIQKIGIFARYAPQKNCDRIVDVVNEVVSKTKIPFEIHWYGQAYDNGIPMTMFKEMQQKINLYSLQNVFYLHNHIKNVAEKMQEFDAICLLSITEGFSNVLAEAICCGRPIIASDVSDNRIMVKNKENGILADPKDVSSMSNAIISFLEMSKDEKEKMAVKSREIAVELFNKDSFINQYKSLIDES